MLNVLRERSREYLPAKSTCDMDFRSAFSCYSRNSSSVTFSLQSGQMPLCSRYHTTPHRDTYESSSSEKTDHQNCRGGERSAEVCRISSLVRRGARVRTDFRGPARDFDV